MMEDMLMELLLTGNEIGYEGLGMICESLKINTTLTSLNLTSIKLKKEI